MFTPMDAARDFIKLWVGQSISLFGSLSSRLALPIPEVEVATYWTSLDAPAEAVLPWYPDHGTMEQYHSEYKTDLDLERLPSGKFATNQLILQLACLVFNVLRIIGQATLEDPAGCPCAARPPGAGSERSSTTSLRAPRS